MASRAPQGFRSQVAPAAAQPLPQSSAERFGAGLGRVIQQIGDVAQQQRLQDQQIEQKLEADRQAGEFQRRFGEAREAASALSRESRLTAGVGHARQLAEEWQKLRDPLLEGIDHPEVRQRAEASLDEFGIRFRTGEADFEVAQVARQNVDNFRRALNTAANRTRRLESVDDYAAELTIQLDAIDGLQTVDQAGRTALADEAEQTLAVNFLQGMIDRDPEAAKALIDSAAFDATLTPQQVEALRNGADVEIRRAAAQAERDQAASVAEFRQEVALVKEAQSQGIDVTDRLDALARRAGELGDTTLALDLDGLVADNRFARTYGGQTPVQIERRIADLRRVPQRTPQQQRELKWLETNRSPLAEGFDSDPAGWLTRNDSPPPPVDLADPSSFAAAARWATAQTAAIGRPVTPFTKAQIDQFEANMTTPAGERLVMEALGAMPITMRTQVARQIVPTDESFAVMVTLPKPMREFALRGRDALKNDKRFLQKFIDEDPDLAEDFVRIQQEFTGALRTVAPGQRAAILTTAKRILAGKMDKQGSDFNGLGWRRALHQALGGEGDPNAGGDQSKGGLGRWFEDSWFVVPAGMTPRQFSTRIKQAAAQGRQRAVNPDGSPVNMSRVVPVLMPGGRYRLRTAAGEDVADATGAVWEFTP